MRILFGIALGLFCLHAEKFVLIKASEPTGSCCTMPSCVSDKNPNGEGASKWSPGAGAWACQCDGSGAIKINPTATFKDLQQKKIQQVNASQLRGPTGKLQNERVPVRGPK